MINRDLTKIINENFFTGKAILLLGARQVGKSTLIKQLLTNHDEKVMYLNGDDSDVRAMFENATSTGLQLIFGNNKIIVIDEAQRIKNIGLALKIAVDNFPERQIIVTGSSSLDLSNELNEPLTGRKYQYYLYPISFTEMTEHTSFIEEKRLIPHRMVYGYYPEIVTKPTEEIDILTLLTESYLYKDLFMLENIKKHTVFERLLQALALQLGNEVSYNEIGSLIGSDKETVEKYIDLLEKSFVIFKLSSLSRNARNEIKKGKKIYFYDNGIRNAIIKNYNPLNLRTDTGALWKNFVISERLKANQYKRNYANYFFWRTLDQKEVDFIEERGGKLYGYEFKWNITKKYKPPALFKEYYPESEIKIITPDNFYEILG